MSQAEGSGGNEFDNMCYGKGKSDDITVVSMWIAPRNPVINTKIYNHHQ